MSKLMESVSAEQRPVAEKFLAAGMSWSLILDFLRTYGSEVVALADSIIEWFKNRPTPTVQTKSDTCTPELAKALCAAHCSAIHTLCDIHAACHEAGCCPDDPA